MERAARESADAGRLPRKDAVRRGRVRVPGVAVLALAAALPGLAARPDAASASAFFVREQSATALGNAFAGATAGADDVTYMFYNGAALGRQEGSQAASVASLIVSRAKFGDGAAGTVTGVPIGGGEGGRNGGELSMVPALYALWDAAGDAGTLGNVRLGLAINAPFGFETEYEEGWIGRYHAVQSRLRSISLNPVLSLEPVRGVTVAAGLQAERIEARLTNAVDYGTLGALFGVPGAQPTRQDGFSKLVGDDWGFGWTAGLLLEPWEGTRLGVAYRSAVRHEIEGDARLRPDDAGIATALGVPAGTTAAKARLTTPEVVSVGVHHALDEAWAVMAEATWTRWSRMRLLRVTFDDGVLPDDVTEEDWRDTWFFAAGVTFRPSEAWTLRTGFGYDQSPARNATRTPRTPVNSGFLLGLGASYQPLPALGLAVGYNHWFIESAPIDLRADGPGNSGRGNLSGSSRNAVDTLSVQATWNF